MFKLIYDKFHNLFSPAFKWIQVEISSLCNGKCIYCPHTIYKDNWHGSLMNLDTFNRLIPSLRRVKLVYLQGWGEPFLNPDIFEMIEIAKKEGCRVGTTTNGNLVNDEMIERMTAADLDILTLSLAGGANHNNILRAGTDIDHILKQIKKLGDLKKQSKASKPEIHIAYMMTQSNREETKHILEYLDGLPVDSLVISTLDFTACRTMVTEEVYPRSEVDFNAMRSILEQIKVDGQKIGIAVNYYLGSPDQKYFTCTELPLYTCFVAADGSVSPCVFTSLPVSGAEYLSDGQSTRYSRLIFGNINSQSLAVIWRKPTYKRFRSQFSSDKYVSPCEECRKIHIMTQ